MELHLSAKQVEELVPRCVTPLLVVETEDVFVSEFGHPGLAGSRHKQSDSL